MKTINTKTLLIATLSLALATGITSCKKQGCTDVDASNFDSKAKKDDGSCTYSTPSDGGGSTSSDVTLSGEVTADKTIRAIDNNTLKGGVHVKAGSTLTIEAGAKLIADPNESVAYILIEQGAKIIAEGTAEAPILFTSSDAKRGSWGGLILCGRAPIGGGTRTAEVGNVTYGGTDASDNSGILRYVRVEYTGNAINSEKEHNGITFNGVGNGTVVSHCQAYFGNDDGFEWFGGTVNCSNLVAIGCKDDSFDWTYGYTGSLTYLYAKQASDEGDRGIEADNDSKANDNSPFSNPTIANVTLIGRGVSFGTDGIKLREGTKGNISNVIIEGFNESVDIEHNQTFDNVAAGGLKVSNVKTMGDKTALKYSSMKKPEIAGSSWATDSTTNANKLLSAEASGNIVVAGASGTATGSGTDWFGTWVRQ
ncbi:MAG: multidrug transporter [Flavobacteriales bacterium]|nr:multidrug transporter [Flavobacteriales bacterium]